MPDDRPQDMKIDAGKPMMELLDPEFELEVAKVLTFGAKKYAPNKWREGLSTSRIIGAIKRHINAIERNEDYDAETGLHHAAHLGCEVMFLHWTILHRPEVDDRWWFPAEEETNGPGTERTLRSPDAARTLARLGKSVRGS